MRSACWPGTGLYGDRHRDALARHRREHGGVHRRRRAAAAQASGAKPEELVVFDWLRNRIDGGPLFRHGLPGPAPGLGIRTSFSALTVERFGEHTATLSNVFAFSPAGTLNVVADRQADTASGLFVSGNYFPDWPSRPSSGQHIVSVDDRPQAEPAAMISHRYWRRRLRAPEPRRQDHRRQPVAGRDWGSRRKGSTGPG